MSMAERVRVSKGVGEYVCGFGQLSECEDVCVCLGCVYGFLGACVFMGVCMFPRYTKKKTFKARRLNQTS